MVYVVLFRTLSSINAFLQIVIAGVLIYAVISIRLIIGKSGLSQRINYRMFVVNAFGMGMYTLAICVWTLYFFKYSATFYGESKTDVEKTHVRTVATQAWIGCNVISFLSQLALIAILCQLGQSEKRPEQKKKQPQATYLVTEDDIERVEYNMITKSGIG